MTDHLSEFGARLLAIRIEEYWNARGKDMRAVVIPGPELHDKTMYFVRSDLVLHAPIAGPKG